MVAIVGSQDSICVSRRPGTVDGVAGRSNSTGFSSEALSMCHGDVSVAPHLFWETPINPLIRVQCLLPRVLSEGIPVEARALQRSL